MIINVTTVIIGPISLAPIKYFAYIYFSPNSGKYLEKYLLGSLGGAAV